MRSLKYILVFLILLLSFDSFAATTYYIDYAGGADTNNGTAKETPFKRAPGMVGCSDTCASTTPAAGDSFIFKGGVTWPNATMGWLWTWSGNATDTSPGCTGTGCIYIGVDKTWYAGGSWTRPILNAEGSAVATRDFIINTLLRIYANYVIFDNLELTGLHWTGTSGTPAFIAFGAGSPGVGTNVELKNLYIHGWSHGTYAGGTREIAVGVLGDTSVPNNNANSILHSSVIDGEDTAKDSLCAVFGGPPYVERNFIRYTKDGGLVNGAIRWNGNTITNIVDSFEEGAHKNGLEINASEDVVISNNIIANLGAGVLGIWTAPFPTYTSYIFNNLLYNTDTGNVVDLAPAVYIAGKCTQNESYPVYCTVQGSHYVFNNTIECGQDSSPDAVCIAGIADGTTAVTIKNNHAITNATTPNGGLWSRYNEETPVTASDNLVQTKATANGQGFNSSQTYPFYPTDGADGTVGAGTDLTASCSGVLTGLCSSAGVGVLYNATSHTVTYPFLTQETRPDGSPWDIGAYQLGGESTYTLTVTKVGTGTITSNVAGIDCGSTCANVYDAATEVTLTASYADNQKVTWGGTDGGGCSGDTCTVTMSAAKAVTATFTNLTGQGVIGGTGGATIGGSGGATIQR